MTAALFLRDKVEQKCGDLKFIKRGLDDILFARKIHEDLQNQLAFRKKSFFQEQPLLLIRCLLTLSLHVNPLASISGGNA